MGRDWPVAHKLQLEAAAAELGHHGIDIALPWEGTLDDLERDRFNGLVAAIEAAERVKRPKIISQEELARITELAQEYIRPAAPREGHQTIAVYGKLMDALWSNLWGILEAARRGVES